MIEEVFSIIGFIAIVAGGAAFIEFKRKVRPFIIELAETADLTWNFLKDSAKDQKCDPFKVAILLKRIEKCWKDGAALAPFVRKILEQIPKRV